MQWQEIMQDTVLELKFAHETLSISQQLSRATTNSVRADHRQRPSEVLCATIMNPPQHMFERERSHAACLREQAPRLARTGGRGCQFLRPKTDLALRGGAGCASLLENTPLSCSPEWMSPRRRSDVEIATCVSVFIDSLEERIGGSHPPDTQVRSFFALSDRHVRRLSTRARRRRSDYGACDCTMRKLLVEASATRAIG